MLGLPATVAHDAGAYDVLSNLLQVTDAAGNITSMAYGPLGRKAGMSDPDMGSWSLRWAT